MLDIWPPLPMIIVGSDDPKPLMGGADNILAALEHVDRVRHINFDDIPSPLLEKFTAAMRKSFPALTVLRISSSDEWTPILPDSFLGGSAPHLRSLYMRGIPFPATARLLYSTLDLVKLDLSDIPDSGYISPEAMVICLSTLTRIQELHLGFRSPHSRPDLSDRHPPPPTRIVLPSLTSLTFQGVSDYFEALVSRIDTPLLDIITIIFFNQLVFDIVHLPRFISRLEKIDTFDQADVVFGKYSVELKLSLRTGTLEPRRLALEIACEESDWQVSSLAQVCRSLLPLSTSGFTLGWLYLREHQDQRPHWQDDMENGQWLELFHSFSEVKNLYLSEEVARRVAPALQDLSGETVSHVLPSLENLFLEGRQPSGKVQEAIRQFVTMRQLSGYPVAVHVGQEGPDAHRLDEPTIPSKVTVGATVQASTLPEPELYGPTVAVHVGNEMLW